MKYECDIKDTCFERSICFVCSQDAKDVFGSGKPVLRRVYIEAFAVMIVPVCLITVNRKKRKQTDKLKTLSQNIGYRYIVCVIII